MVADFKDVMVAPRLRSMVIEMAKGSSRALLSEEHTGEAIAQALLDN